MKAKKTRKTIGLTEPIVLIGSDGTRKKIIAKITGEIDHYIGSYDLLLHDRSVFYQQMVPDGTERQSLFTFNTSRQERNRLSEVDSRILYWLLLRRAGMNCLN